MKSTRILCLCCLQIALCGAALAQQLPSFGNQTAENQYRFRRTELLTLNFENLDPSTPMPSHVKITADKQEVITGTRSLKLTAVDEIAIFPIGKETLQLDPYTIYIMEYKYRVLRPGISYEALGAQYLPLGPMIIIGGSDFVVLGNGVPAQGPAVGRASAGLRTGARPSIAALISMRSDVVLDDIVIWRQDIEAYYRPDVPLWDIGFPRLAKYNIGTSEHTAAKYGLPVDQVETTLSMYDVLLGVDIDHTLGAAGWIAHLRNLNPRLRILPYHNSFVADETNTTPLDDAADLKAMFLKGIPDEWFMVGPDKKRLREFDYPSMLQLDHTLYCPSVNGSTARDYIREYLAGNVLPSGLWDGILFDQPEWIVNPLLASINPGSRPYPPIDLDRDGVAESLPMLHSAWFDGFLKFFEGMADRLGYGQLMFGNAGYIPANPLVLRYLNGWLQEVASPYEILSDGSWNTDNATGWYRLLSNYLLANRTARAPQLIAIEGTGMGLGEPTGTATPNTWADRKNKIEFRDYRRMRLGLTTALLGNGFFGYDLVDNTSAPLWCDEYAVDADGFASTSPSAKGYLGQPLGDAAELPYPAKTIFDIDFESTSTSPVSFAAGAVITSDPEAVIEGNSSLVVRRGSSNPDGLFFWADARSLSLVPGKTYQFMIDYRIIDYQPKECKGFVACGFFNRTTEPKMTQLAALYHADVAGLNQAGTLRASVKLADQDCLVAGYLWDEGTLVVDNIRLVEGSGGAWVRHFENGLVVVNPTPENLQIPLYKLTRALGRTGIRFIRGWQDPSWNSGRFLTSAGITIPPADGAVLLAAHSRVRLPRTPQGIRVLESSGDRVVLGWQKNREYVAGYHIVYGEDATFTTSAHRSAASGQPFIELRGLESGELYWVRVSAYDFWGNLSPYSQAISFRVPGYPRLRPVLNMQAGTQSLSSGRPATLRGIHLADREAQAGTSPYPVMIESTAVLINGTPAELVSITPDQIDLIVPSIVRGSQALVRVYKGGTPSADYVFPLR